MVVFRINEVNLLPRLSNNIGSRNMNQMYVYFWCLIWSYRTGGSAMWQERIQWEVSGREKLGTNSFYITATCTC
jgi:hypothetical protein